MIGKSSLEQIKDKIEDFTDLSFSRFFIIEATSLFL